MKIVRSADGLATALGARGGSVGFVPTMGALHDGHLSLVRRARTENEIVVVSIFVNPLQFGPGEDLESYPRNEAADTRALEEHGADLVFIPEVEEVHPPGRTTTVHVAGLSDVLEGAHRPGHFDGVSTVVATLFNLVRPDRAYFGQKDAQQVAVLQRMVRDLAFPLRLIVGPIVREPSGLAMSSRNAYLSESQRRAAGVLYRALKTGERWAREGSFDRAEKEMEAVLRSAGEVDPDYARVVDPETFEPAHPGGDALLVVAAKVGPARLIDNLLLKEDSDA